MGGGGKGAKDMLPPSQIIRGGAGGLPLPSPMLMFDVSHTY